VVLHERPAAAILATAGEQPPADVIALATHGRSGLKRLALGSVTDKMLHGATAPVLVCRPPGGPVKSRP
jgi:nucleotide-binding universal stress UspA family protein